MVPRLLLLLFSLSAAVLGDDGALTWRPFDHPVTLKQVHSAWTSPTHSFQLASEVSGKVTELTLEEGEVVPGSPGTNSIVARIDDAIARHQLEAKRAAHAVAEGLVDAASVAKRRTDIALEHYKRELVRIEGLAAQKRASEMELDDARFNARDAEVARDLAAAREEQSRREMEAATHQVKIAEARLDHHILRAPAGWRVEQRSVEVGSLATIGSSLYRLVDLRTVDASFHVSEKGLAVLLSTRQPPLQRASNSSFVASRVRFVSSAADPITRKRRVVLEIPAEEFELEEKVLAGGIEVRLELQVPNASGGIRIPRRFIGSRLEQMIVKTLDGSIYPVIGVNADDDAWIVLPGKLPRDAELIAP